MCKDYSFHLTRMLTVSHGCHVWDDGMATWWINMRASYPQWYLIYLLWWKMRKQLNVFLSFFFLSIRVRLTDHSKSSINAGGEKKERKEQVSNCCFCNKAHPNDAQHQKDKTGRVWGCVWERETENMSVCVCVCHVFEKWGRETPIIPPPESQRQIVNGPGDPTIHGTQESWWWEATRPNDNHVSTPAEGRGRPRTEFQHSRVGVSGDQR